MIHTMYIRPVKFSGRNCAFTLLEMSMVLVIIGLIIGGILIGRSLIRQSQINSVMTDFQNYTKAVLNFKDKYSALPGDMGNATSYWGTAGGASGDNYTVSCSTHTGTGTQTCNGDNNGQINEATSTSYRYETFRAWQQLANAGFIEGNFTGVSASGSLTYEHSIGSNSPASRIDGAGYTISWIGVQSGSSSWYNHNYLHVIMFGTSQSITTGHVPSGPTLTTLEAQSIDNKYDDGAPSTGNIMSWPVNSPYLSSCTTSASAYDLSTSGEICSVFFNPGF